MKTNIENIKKFPERFGKALAEKLGWTLTDSHNGFRCIPPNGGLHHVLELASLLDVVRQAELQVIEKVGIFEYLNALCKVFYGEQFNLNNYNALLFYQAEDLTTADAPSRLTACLLALNVLEVEDSK